MTYNIYIIVYLFLLKHQKETKMLRFSRCLLARKLSSKRFFLAAAYVLPLGTSHYIRQNLKGCTNPSLKSFCTHYENRLRDRNTMAWNIHKICQKLFLVYFNKPITTNLSNTFSVWGASFNSSVRS